MSGRSRLQSTQVDTSQDVDSQDGSLMLDTKRIEDMLAAHKTTVKSRRRVVETRLRQAQQEGYAALQARSKTEEVAYWEELRTKQRPYLEDLKDLVEEKRLLEREIERTCDELERAQMTVSQQLAACIKSRVDVLRT